ncbi:MAG: AEC family transporter [Victivallaceae bacterium]|nr:AEC family transporter [Victivallaceae bacterium]
MTSLLIQNLFSLFLVMAAGFALVKCRILAERDAEVLSRIALYLVIPCVTLRAFQVTPTREIAANLLLALGAALAVHAVFLASAPLLRKRLKFDELETLSVIYPNAGNLAMPLVAATLGWDKVIYISAFLAVQQFFLWSHARMMMCGIRGVEWKKVFGNVNMIAVLLGIIVLATGFRYPAPLAAAIASVAQTVGPVTMLISGILLASFDVSELRRYPRCGLVVLLRLIVFPLVFVLLFKYCPARKLVPCGAEILLITLFSIVTPPATTLTLMAQVYGRDAHYANILNVVSTVLCLVTIPVAVWLYFL